MEKITKIKKRTFNGVVKSDKMDKTIVVSVSSTKIHSLYNKRFKTSKNYKVHDPENKHHVGDKVVFEECKPISKDKKWKVIS